MPATNDGSVSRVRSRSGRAPSRAPRACQARASASGSIAPCQRSASSSRSAWPARNSSPSLPRSSTRRSPPTEKVSTASVWRSTGAALRWRSRRPAGPRSTTRAAVSGAPSRPRSSRLPIRAVLPSLRPTSRSANSGRLRCRRTTRAVRTSTDLTFRPPTSLSRSPRRVSTSGNSGKRAPPAGRLARAPPGRTPGILAEEARAAAVGQDAAAGLAGRAVGGLAVAHPDRADGVAADEAGRPGAGVDGEQPLRGPGDDDLVADLLGQGGPGLGEDPDQGGVQALDLLGAEALGAGEGRHLGPVEHVVGPGVADPGHGPLVGEHALEGVAALGQDGGQALGGEARVERLGAEAGQGRDLLDVVDQPDRGPALGAAPGDGQPGQGVDRWVEGLEGGHRDHPDRGHPGPGQPGGEVLGQDVELGELGHYSPAGGGTGAAASPVPETMRSAASDSNASRAACCSASFLERPLPLPYAVPATETVAVKRLARSEEHTSELQSHSDLVCRLLLEKKKKKQFPTIPSKKNKKKT